MATTTTAYQGQTYVHQDGEIVVGSWNDGGVELEGIALALPTSIMQVGIIFDLSSIVDETTRIAQPTQFTLYAAEATTQGKVWNVYVLHESDPEDFAGSATDNEPNARRLANGALVCQVTLPTLAEDEAFTFIPGQTYDGTSWSVSSAYTTQWNKFYGNWRGSSHSKKIAFVMEQAYTDETGSDPRWHSEAATTETLRPSFTVVEWGAHTGHNKAQPGDRAVYDMRTGRACGASELQEDGYLPGVWVLDPDSEDIRRTPPELPDTERERQDEVPT